MRWARATGACVVRGRARARVRMCACARERAARSRAGWQSAQGNGIVASYDRAHESNQVVCKLPIADRSASLMKVQWLRRSQARNSEPEPRKAGGVHV